MNQTITPQLTLKTKPLFTYKSNRGTQANLQGNFDTTTTTITITVTTRGGRAERNEFDRSERKLYNRFM